MPRERREAIAELLRVQGEVTLEQLSEIYPNVSMMTLRRDLIHLEENGLLRRTRGGAVAMSGLHLPSEDALSQRLQSNVMAKRQIAKKAAALIETGRSIYIDSGSTCMFLARCLPQNRMSVITSSPSIAMELAVEPMIDVVILGGRLGANTLSVSGSETCNQISNINIDTAIMATSGFTVDAGFTAGSYDESEVKRLAIERARHVIMLMDTSKVGHVLPYTFGRLDQIHSLVVDDHLPETVGEACRAAGVTLY